MKRHLKSSRLLLSLLFALGCFLANPLFLFAAPIDLSTWTVVQYELNSQPNANWVLSMGNTVATQNVNADASILLSDFDAANKLIQGTWRVATTGDDDFMGFVFGYQDRGHYYLFDWKQSDQNDPLGFAEAGMSVKRVSIPGGADPTGLDLWPTAGSANVALLAHNTIPWLDNTDYGFRLEFVPGNLKIEVRQDAALLASFTINDNTYLNGLFGFYNYSQGDVVYRGFTQDQIDPSPPAPTAIPEPSSFLVWSLVGLGLALCGWRSGSRGLGRATSLHG